MDIVRPILIGAAALLTVAPSVGLAQSSAVTDIRCLLLSNGFAGSATEAKAKEVAAISRTFYLGRVSMLSPSQIQAARRSLPKQFDAATAGRIMNQCAEQVQKTGKDVETLLQKPVG